MKAKVINVEPGTWPKDNKPFWAVSAAQEGKEPIKLYASTKEIGEGLKPGQEYDFTLKTTGKEGQPLKYPYITEAVKIISIGGSSLTAHTGEPDPLDAELAGKPPTPPTKPPATKLIPIIAPTQNGEERKERAIARAVALKAAVESLQGQAFETQQAAMEQVLWTAREMEKWLTR